MKFKTLFEIRYWDQLNNDWRFELFDYPDAAMKRVEEVRAAAGITKPIITIEKKEMMVVSG